MQLDLATAFQLVVGGVLAYVAFKMRRIDELISLVAVLKDRSDRFEKKSEEITHLASSYQALHSRVDRVEAISESILSKEGVTNERS